MAKFKVVAFETKRYELVIEAKDEDEAHTKADNVDDLCDWDEDYDYYDISIDHVEQLEED